MVCNLCKATGATSGTGTVYLSVAPECNSNICMKLVLLNQWLSVKKTYKGKQSLDVHLYEGNKCTDCSLVSFNILM